MQTGFVYILQCADGSYYTGSHRGNSLNDRVNDHNNGLYPNAYTYSRRPVKLVWSDWFSRFDDMVAAERQIKGWSRVKKEALIRGDFQILPALSKKGYKPVSDPYPSTRRSSREEQRLRMREKMKKITSKKSLTSEPGASAPVSKDEGGMSKQHD